KILLLGMFTSATALAQGSAPRTLGIEDVYRVHSLSQVQVSADGAWVSYIVEVNDRAADEAKSSLWLASFDGRQHIALTAATEALDKPRFSPDGRYISYLATIEGHHGRLMLLDRRGGNAQMAGDEAGEISEYAWSPDGKSLVLLRGSAEPTEPKPLVIDALHFK